MKPELYEEVHEIVLEIVNTSFIEDKKSEWVAYQKLANLCEASEKAGNNHPFQWETLADFTFNKESAIELYEKALGFAQEAKLDEYISSICLAMAEVLLGQGRTTQARDYAMQANKAATRTDDIELRKSISELLLQLSSST